MLPLKGFYNLNFSIGLEDLEILWLGFIETGRGWCELPRTECSLELLVKARIVGAVPLPPSFGCATNIDDILQAANEIQSEDPQIARIRPRYVHQFDFCDRHSFQISTKNTMRG
ncbi:uncharacterized protein LOC111297265 isoform X2 [Durio zibethinus]|uniref:Uncharacterized protein LOC111297265 isoform X2 n=1 Tax=Durio zibethinus TaxID=66656 RepID=A0A6P5Z4G8_DURZI|nr:uncharacterized protein LOC111297265 isoform X2 [Durio zibethinus]